LVELACAATQASMRTNGKPLESVSQALGLIIRVSSLVCQSFVERMEGSMSAISDDRYVSLLARDQYFRALRWRERSSAEEEADYLRRLALGKRERAKVVPDASVVQRAQDARNQLVVDYQFLIISVAQRLIHSFQHMEFLDLVHEASAVLLKRLDEYCDNPVWDGRPFSFFVSSVTYKAMFTALRRRDRMVSLPHEWCGWLGRKRAIERAWNMQFGRTPTFEELVQQMGVSEAVLRDVIAYEQYLRVESVQALLAEDEMEEEHAFSSVFDQRDPQAEDDEQQWMLAETMQYALEHVLTAREREVIMLRYRFDDGATQLRTLEVVAEVLGLDYRYVFEVEQRALWRLKQALEYTVQGGRVQCRVREVYRVAYYVESQAASVLGLAPTTFRRRVHAGLVPYYFRSDKGEMRLYPKDAIDALAASGVFRKKTNRLLQEVAS
jgi:RNA polymerase sigma factor (sigma-70 family)